MNTKEELDSVEQLYIESPAISLIEFRERIGSLVAQRESALSYLGHAVWIYTNNTRQDAIDPTGNNGSEFVNDTFEMRAFDWSDPEVYAPNFKYKDFEVEWYKYLGRGMEINRDITPDEINEMLLDCLKSLEQSDV